MLPKKQRLTIKEVNYILHKRTTISWPDLLFFVIPQYYNRPYHQRWIQLSTKLHKRSTKRNKVKRIFYDQIALTLNWITSTVMQQSWIDRTSYVKTIALIHKTKLEERYSLLDTDQRASIQKKIKDNIDTIIQKINLHSYKK